MTKRLSPIAFALAATCPALASDQLTQFLAEDGDAFDELGYSVGVSGATGIAGARFHDHGGYANAGAAYLFDVATGAQLAELSSEPLGIVTTGDEFGTAVAIDGPLAVVGAPMDDVGTINNGAAFVFDVGSGQPGAFLLANDGVAGDRLGGAVAIDGDRVIVGATGDDDFGQASGAAYVFDANTGQQLVKLLPNDGAAGDQFGFSVGISGTRAIVGAPFDDDMGSDSGSAYLFDITTGQQIAKLTTLDQSTQALFGWSVDVDGTTALVGARSDHENGFYSGAAYVFDAFSGAQLVELQPPTAQQYSDFGISVAIDGERMLIGSQRRHHTNGVLEAGAAFLFDRASSQLLDRLEAEPPQLGSWFGVSVALSGTVAVVGCHRTPENGFMAGSAYAFRLALPIGTSYCGPANSNSSGDGGLLSASGSTVVAENLVELHATSLAPNQFAMFLNSRTQGFALPPGSQGNLCLGGAIGRHVQDVQSTGPGGTALLALELADTPTPTGPVAIQPGETWNFQLWFRDAGGTSNFTDGLSIVFE